MPENQITITRGTARRAPTVEKRVTVIKNVVFDVGRVLIDYSYDTFFALLRNNGAQIVDEQDFVRQVDLIEYEHGRMSAGEFLRRVNALLNDPMPEQDLRVAWNDLFTPIPEMLFFAGQLKSRCRVYLFSNTSDLHWAHLQQTYALNAICHGLAASCELGAMKPAPEAYREMERRFGLLPQETLFIDDKEENVAGALACGWQGIWHRDVLTTKTRIDDLCG